MRVFVSTERTQGQKKKDFCFVPEGELVVSPSDGGPYLIGSQCFKATTTFAVEEMAEMTGELYALAIFDCRKRQMGGIYAAGMDEDLRKEAVQEALALAKAAAAFEPGSVIGATRTQYVLREGPA